jgi:transposase InsO family protein
VVPKKFREEIMAAHHDADIAGHFGYFKTINSIGRWFYWPNMNDDVKNWVQQCQVCQQYKGTTKERVGKLQPIRATRPFEIVGMDILTDLPVTPRGNKHILVFTNYFTKWPEAFALSDMKAETVARVYVNEIIMRHGAPSRIITDRGDQFIADVFREVTELLNTKHSMTTAYHPQTDRQAERMVGTIFALLR